MIWDSTIATFLSTSKPSSAKEYGAKLNTFHKYLIDRFDITDKNYVKIMGDLNSDDILGGVDYYINSFSRKKIEYRSPVRGYLTAVLEYIKFLTNEKDFDVENSWVNNSYKVKDLRVCLSIKKYSVWSRKSTAPSTPKVDWVNVA